MDKFDGGDVKLNPTAYLFLKGDPCLRSTSFVEKVWVQASCGGIAASSMIIHNLVSKRPTFAGIQRIATYGLVGLMIGQLLVWKKGEVLSEKDLQYFHYMTLHPEDFAPPDRCKYKDYLAPWLPIR